VLRTDRRTYSKNGTYVTFPLTFLAIFGHTRLKNRHTSKNGMNRIKENLLLPIVLQVTQVPMGSYGRTDRQTEAIPIVPFPLRGTGLIKLKF
jgi:hypothetical protein